MSTASLVAIAVFAVLAALLTPLALILRAPRQVVRIHATGPASWVVRTPIGRAKVEGVMHADLGYVYEVRANFKGEGPTTVFVPPALPILRQHIENRTLH